MECEGGGVTGPKVSVGGYGLRGGKENVTRWPMATGTVVVDADKINARDRDEMVNILSHEIKAFKSHLRPEYSDVEIRDLLPVTFLFPSSPQATRCGYGWSKPGVARSLAAAIARPPAALSPRMRRRTGAGRRLRALVV